MDASQWMVNHMLSLVGSARPAVRFNPRPPSKIHEGSGTTLTLNFLRSDPKRCFQFCQIVQATGSSRNAVCFGLLYLRSRGLIECFMDPRNARYLVYRAKDDA